MRSDTESQVEGFFAGAYDFTRTNSPTENETLFRVACFCAAISTGDTTIVDMLLQEGFNVNETVEAVDEGIYIRPLTAAILDGNIEMAKHLIEKGAEVGNAPLETPTYGATMIVNSLQLEPTKAIAMILGLQATRERFKSISASKKKPDEIDPTMRFTLSRSPLAAACYMKSSAIVEALLDAGAEFGDYYYVSLGFVLDNEKTCEEEERKKLLDLVLSSRDRIGFDRFIDATSDFEQYVNGEWRRSFAADDYNPAETAQMKAWRACDRLLTSPAYRKRLPMSQLLYEKYCALSLDDIISMIDEIAKTIDAPEDLAGLGSALIPLNARRFCLSILFPLQLGIVPNPKTGKKVLVACQKWSDSSDETGMMDALKTVVMPMLQEKAPDVEIDLDDCESMLNEIAIVGDQTVAQAALGEALSQEHSVKDYRGLFGESMEEQFLMVSSLVSMPALMQGEDDCPIYYDESAIKKVLGFLNAENLGRIKNYMKVSYIYSLTRLIQAKASEQDAGNRFSSFASMCGPLISDELSPVYLENVMDDKAIGDLEDMFQNIKHAYQLAIEKSEHLSDESRTKALHKLDDINLIIVGTNQANPPIEGTLILDDWNFIDNANRLSALSTEKELARLLAGDDDASTLTSGKAWDYNAGYSLQTNNVELFGAYLLPPAYSQRRSSVMNYAAIGRVMGHEISHAFDPKSITVLRALGEDDAAVDIFSSSPTYSENVEKLKRQFRDKIPRRLAQAMPVLLVHNEFDYDKCIGENFADVVGLEIALYAYALSRDCETVADLVEQNPDDVKLFMQSYALSMREKPSLNWLIYQMLYDVHAPNEFRANTVKNLDAFHEVFGTKEGDGMWLDPSERVSVLGIR